MQITCFSFFTAVLWSSVLVAFTCFCRKKRFFIRQFGVESLLLLYFLCFIRMAVPLEFRFTKALESSDIVNDVYRSIQVDKIGRSDFSIMAVFQSIWIIVSIGLLIRFAWQYVKEIKEVSLYHVREDAQCKDVLRQILNNHKKQLKIQVRCHGDISTPMGIGIFRKSILLPDEDYTDQELYYILSHEYAHFLNNDLSIKILIHILCCIFWWNPIVYLLKKNLNQTLEIRCDLYVTENMDKEGKADYLSTIVSVMKKARIKRKSAKLYYGTASFVTKNYESEIVERFKFVSENQKLRSKNKVFASICFLVLLAILVFSYSFVIHPYFKTPIEEIETDGTTRIWIDNSYIVKNEDGTYTLVMLSGETLPLNEEFALRMEGQGFKIMEEEIR